MQSHKLLNFQQQTFEQTFALHVRCGKMAPRMKWCSGCEFARYCGRDCQKADYRAHRIDCNGQWNRTIRHSGRGHFFGMFSGYDFYLWRHLLLQSSPSPVKLWCVDSCYERGYGFKVNSKVNSHLSKCLLSKCVCSQSVFACSQSELSPLLQSAPLRHQTTFFLSVALAFAGSWPQLPSLL